MSTIVNLLLTLSTFIDWILIFILIVLVFSVMMPLYHYIIHEQIIEE